MHTFYIYNAFSMREVYCMKEMNYPKLVKHD